MESNCLTVAAGMGSAIVAMAIYIRYLHSARIEELRERVASEREAASQSEAARADAVALIDALIAKVGGLAE